MAVRQPQYVSPIDYGNPVSRGLVAAVYCVGGVMFDAVSGRQLTKVNTPLVSNTLHGPALETNGTNQYAWLDITGFPDAGNATLLSVSQDTGTASDGRLLSLGWSGGNNPVVGITRASTAGRLYGFARNNAGSGFTSVINTAGTLVNDGRQHNILMRLDNRQASASLAFFIDGQPDGSYSGTFGTTTINRLAVNALLRATAAAYWKGPTNLSLLWSRPLSDAEAISVTQNPWQVFKAQKRNIWIEQATGGVTLNPPLVSNGQSFYAATLTSGAVSLAPALFSNNNAFYAASVNRGAVSLSPARFDNAATFYAPTVSRGAVSVAPPRIDNDQVFYGATISQGGTSLQPARVENVQTFYAATITRGAVTLSPERLNNAQTFFAPSVTSSYGLAQSARFNNANAIYAPSIVVAGAGLYPPLLQNSNIFYAPRVVNAGSIRPIDPSYQSASIANDYQVIDIDSGYNKLTIESDYYGNPT